jgi:adenosylhomocysteine nucleosidase
VTAPIALIGAMNDEVAPLLAGGDFAVEAAGPIRWHAGAVEGVPVLIAACGIGKVNAAALTQSLLQRGARAVLFTGVAGALDPTLRVGDLVVATDAVQHDVDVTGLGYALGVVPGEPASWSADPALSERLATAATAVAQAEGVRLLRGRVASGDAFIADSARASALRERFGALCAEMEGAAVAQVCARWGVPWAIVRSISDGADHGAKVDFRAFTAVVARRAVAVIRATLRDLAPMP